MGARGHPGQSHLILPPGRGRGAVFSTTNVEAVVFQVDALQTPLGVQVAMLLRYANILAYTFLLV